MKQICIKSSVAAIAAVVCLSSTAFALENEFHGMLLIKGDFTNFDQAGGNDVLKASTRTPANILSQGDTGKSFFFTEQRARILYKATITDDVKLVTQFEIDSRWGDTSQSTATTRNVGGAMEADQVNLETKNVYMQFKVPYLPTTVTAGIQPFDDAYKGIFLSSDIAGVMTSTKFGNGNLRLGWLRGYDNKNFNGADSTIPAVNAASDSKGTSQFVPGRYSLDLAILEGNFNLSKELKVGGSYYMTYDNLAGGYNVLSTFGVNAAYNFGAGVVDGFVLYQVGDNPTNNFGRTGAKVSAFAANLGGKVKAGPGTARANFLYASGDDGTGGMSGFQGVNQLGDGNTTSTFSAAQMTMLITNTKYAANTDRGIINTVSNYDQGVIGAFLGYDLDIDKTFLKGNLGMAAAARENPNFKLKNQNTGGFNSNYLGTEVNAEVGYRIAENLTASLVGGYVFLGDYWTDTAKPAGGIAKTPDNPWKTQAVLRLVF
jgi:hypothetical protein